MTHNTLHHNQSRSSAPAFFNILSHTRSRSTSVLNASSLFKGLTPIQELSVTDFCLRTCATHTQTQHNSNILIRLLILSNPNFHNFQPVLVQFLV